ncbi:protein-ADP-ribose hydrolase [Zongyangia hominis]|uniref:Protein-ADP-ribose hydrolase n=1 Tax=Zongyangia hominis TaxID=2763677 RepID=A0A926EFF7_9FIRM|nr:protein-ADP-ribose hydrolase [Zongyangia hominis]MBC8571086.1 protein-ADP-ribose hydrolase [Zongyangia hominis]
MQRLELIKKLNAFLLDEMPQYRQEAAQWEENLPAQRRLLRSLMNVRPPLPLSPAFVKLQDELLGAEREEKGVVDGAALPATGDPRIALWQGDITRLQVDAIVNAANSALLGCFVPCHGCIDNAIHSAAGLQLREECRQLMANQGHEEPTGGAKMTLGYNLPCRYVLHTVGPIITGELGERDCEALSSCYRSCLELADEKGLRSVAFCCISTGEFHFPPDRAAQIAVSTVREFLDAESTEMRVIFNVFKDSDKAVYRSLLGPNR